MKWIKEIIFLLRTEFPEAWLSLFIPFRKQMRPSKKGRGVAEALKGERNKNDNN